MRTHPLRSMLIAMAIAFGLLALTIAMGKSPKLGLDLQGGVSVNLQPVKDGKVTNDVSAEKLDQAIGIIRKRVDAVGVSEPEVSRQGSTITVQLPGATNQKDVLDLVGKTAELRFRPVLKPLGPVPDAAQKKKLQADIDKLSKELNLPAGVSASQVVADEQAKQAAANPQPATDGSTTPSTPDTAAPTTAAPTTAAPATTAAPGTTADPTKGNGGGQNASARFQTPTTAPGSGGGADKPDFATTTTVAPASPTTTVPPTPLNQYGVNVYDKRFSELYQAEGQLTSKVTPSGEDKADQQVVLVDEKGNAYQLGPTLLTGKAVEDAAANLGQSGKWTVNPKFKDGKDGIDLFNAAATKCFNGDPICPAQQGGKGQLAIVLDSRILTAPSINNATFSRDSIEISGAFTKDSAQAVAVALRYGSLPVELKAQQAETVSATLGQGALRAGILSGLLGLVLVFAFLFLYYRLLALVTLASLATSAALLWVIMSWLGATVTLAGVVGLVVSIGVTIDSSVVSFEGIKEDVRAGATVRSVAERSMTRSYATIIKADTSSLIGAAVLYWLSVGPVRGFAFYLGAATLLDLLSTYFVLRPGVVSLARSGSGRHPKRLGIPIDDLADATQQKIVAMAGSAPGGAVPTGAKLTGAEA